MDSEYKLGFWNYVDCNVLDPEEATKDWKKLGMNLAMSCELTDVKEVPYLIRELDACYKQGIKVIVCDYRVHWRHLAKVGKEQFIKDVDSAVKDFGSHPAFYAFHVGDEPQKEDWADMEEATKTVNEKSVAFVNFLPMYYEDFPERTGVKQSEYADLLIKTVKKTGLKMICYDCYTQCFYNNRQAGLHQYFDNLACFSKVAKETGATLWTTLLSVGHWAFRTPSEDDLRWQLSTAVAHGVKGVLWFYVYARCYEGSFRDSPFDLYYEKTETFSRLSRVNRIFSDEFMKKLSEATLQKTYHYREQFGMTYGSTPLYQDGDIAGFEFQTRFNAPLIFSEFTSKDGDFVLVVNNRQDNVERIYGTMNGKPFSMWLAPGQMYIIDK